MPESSGRTQLQADRGRVLAALAELAGGGLAERMRLDAASRILVTARRMLEVSPREAAAGSDAVIVLDVARDWDPAVTTAAEHVEALAPVELDLFLAAAPRWARDVREASSRGKRRAA